jgi:hypothetical protein
MTSVAKALRDMGFRRTTAGARFGIRPRLVFENVEVDAHRSGIDIRVEHPDGLYGGPARSMSLSFDRWPKAAAIAVVAAIVEHRKEGWK